MARNENEKLQEELASLRSELRAIDERIFSQLILRREKVEAIAHLKSQLKIPVLDSARELENLRANRQFVAGRLSPDFVDEVTTLLATWARDLQNNLKTD